LGYDTGSIGAAKSIAIVSATTNPLRTEEGRVTELRHDLADENRRLRATLDAMQARVEELEKLADCDTLTPLPNRRAFLREVERVLRHIERYATPAALLYVDVNSLKSINDRFGHGAGDAALNHVAAALSGLVRSTDFVARIGGDEFGLVLDHLDGASAADTAERIAECIARIPVSVGGCDIIVSVATGMTTIDKGDTVEGVIARADRNMYAVKAAG